MQWPIGSRRCAMCSRQQAYRVTIQLYRTVNIFIYSFMYAFIYAFIYTCINTFIHTFMLRSIYLYTTQYIPLYIPLYYVVYACTHTQIGHLECPRDGAGDPSGRRMAYRSQSVHNEQDEYSRIQQDKVGYSRVTFRSQHGVPNGVLILVGAIQQ